MKYALVKENVVVQTQKNKKDGFVKVENNVVCGMVQREEGFENPKKTIKVLRQEKKEKIEKDYNREESASVEIAGMTWQAGYDSVLKLDGAKRIAEEAQQATVVFFDASNLPHKLTIIEATDVVVALGVKYQQDFAKYQGLKVAIEKATTQEELDAIGW